MAVRRGDCGSRTFTRVGRVRLFVLLGARAAGAPKYRVERVPVVGPELDPAYQHFFLCFAMGFERHCVLAATVGRFPELSVNFFRLHALHTSVHRRKAGAGLQRFPQLVQGELNAKI